MLEIVDLGASVLDPETGAQIVRCKGGAVSEEDAPDYGETPVFQCLGVTSVPFPADETGGAQGIVAQLPGVDGAIIGARDTRTSAVVGNIKGGDTILHSTGPSQSAQVQCKESKRQVVLATKDSEGKTALLSLDGKNDKVQIAAFGFMIEVSREQGIVMSSETGGASLQIKGSVISLCGQVVLGGRTPIAPVLFSLTPVTGTVGVASVAPGVFVGR